MKVKLLKPCVMLFPSHQVGDIIETTPPIAECLVARKAACYIIENPQIENKAFERPPKDKMIKRGRGRPRVRIK